MLKRLGMLLCLLLATSFITVASSEVAIAGHHRFHCHNNFRNTYVGVDDVGPRWDSHARLARVEIDYHVCVNHRTGRIVHRKSRMHMAIYRNGTAMNYGIHFGHNKARHDFFHHTGDWFTERMYIHGWWNQCLIIKSAFTCGPTGDFTYVWRYNAPWVQRHHHADEWYLYRRAGEPFLPAGPYDSQVNFYNDPT